jgi:hydroxypyruvate reductase
MIEDPATFLRMLFETAIGAANPAHCVPPHLPPPPAGRTIVVGAGKAAAAMAQAVEDHYQGVVSGAVVVPYGHGASCKKIRVIEAAHPVPDAAAEDAARAMLGAVDNLSEEDLVIALMSGGGSALLAQPVPGLPLADKQAVTRALLASGAAIAEINAVRRALSAIKGGRLAEAAHPARIVTLVISDVPGDDPAIVGSGPTILPPENAPSAAEVILKYGIDVPVSVRTALENHRPSPAAETFARNQVKIVARAADALHAAADAAREAGWTAMILGDAIEGEARTVAADHARRALDAIHFRKPGSPPVVLLSGGETTVTLGGGASGEGGKGGRNTEYLLALGLALNRDPRIWAIAADTDGIDGNSDAAGALLTPWSIAGASDHGLDPAGMLAAHRSADVFAFLGHLIVTGPTLTNVNDFRAILIGTGDPAKLDL